MLAEIRGSTASAGSRTGRQPPRQSALQRQAVPSCHERASPPSFYCHGRHQAHAVLCADGGRDRGTGPVHRTAGCLCRVRCGRPDRCLGGTRGDPRDQGDEFGRPSALTVTAATLRVATRCRPAARQVARDRVTRGLRRERPSHPLRASSSFGLAPSRPPATRSSAGGRHRPRPPPRSLIRFGQPRTRGP